MAFIQYTKDFKDLEKELKPDNARGQYGRLATEIEDVLQYLLPRGYTIADHRIMRNGFSLHPKNILNDDERKSEIQRIRNKCFERSLKYNQLVKERENETRMWDKDDLTDKIEKLRDAILDGFIKHQRLMARLEGNIFSHCNEVSKKLFSLLYLRRREICPKDDFSKCLKLGNWDIIDSKERKRIYELLKELAERFPDYWGITSLPEVKAKLASPNEYKYVVMLERWLDDAYELLPWDAYVWGKDLKNLPDGNDMVWERFTGLNLLIDGDGNKNEIELKKKKAVEEYYGHFVNILIKTNQRIQQQYAHLKQRENIRGWSYGARIQRRKINLNATKEREARELAEIWLEKIKIDGFIDNVGTKTTDQSLVVNTIFSISYIEEIQGWVTNTCDYYPKTVIPQYAWDIFKRYRGE